VKVFISWSGTNSHSVALILREWLPSVIQAIEPYVSSVDIDKGARWGTDISVELQRSLFGILCITKENIDAPWINFEAGALSKTVESSKVVPFLFDIKRSDIKSGPLVQFQSTLCEKDDILQMLRSINSSLEAQQLDEAHLVRIFNVWWPQLDAQLHDLQTQTRDQETGSQKKHRKISLEDSGEILEEILDVSRQTNRILNSPTTLLPIDYIESVVDRFSARRGMYEFLNPAFDDLFRRWVALKSQVDRSPDVDGMTVIRQLVAEVDGPLDYIMRHLDIDTRRSQRKRL
jgi:hypothetical protein